MPPDPYSRREFVGFLAASPVLAAAGIDYASLQRLLSGSPRDHAELLEFAQQAAAPAVQQPGVITAASQAFNVFDFEPAARAKAPVAHWGYLATGTDDDGTIRANREGFDRWSLRVRRLVDVSRIDTSVTMLGVKWDTPIVINPVGSQRAFHPQGELATARAAKARGHLQVLSTVATTSIEEVIEARGAPVWFQLYQRQNWAETRQMLKRAEAAGAPAVVFTVDLLGGSNRETMRREALNDTRQCITCHKLGQPLPGQSGGIDDRDNSRKPALNQFTPETPILEVGTPTWEFVDRLRNATKMKIFIKGIVTHEDAELAIQHGASGMFVSNHGGRAENSLRATITALPDVLTGVRGRVPVICDGGFRRGTDIFKALALGATAIGIGRPYMWGLAAFGQEGVETVLALLRKELEMVMRQAGTVSVKGITRAYIVPRGS
jgi:isopentenyl diphosphate isomerase/L-lactate dehydrogenase-like FMN-dependent dehydrogenase